MRLTRYLFLRSRIKKRSLENECHLMKIVYAKTMGRLLSLHFYLQETKL